MVAYPPKSLNYNLCCRTEIQSLLTSSELRPVGVCCVLLWGLRTQQFFSSQILLAEETKRMPLARLVFNLKAIEFGAFFA